MSHSTLPSRRVIGVLALCTLVITLVSLSWSSDRGRLQYEVDYEDVITHIDGLDRWRSLSEGGVGELAAGYVNRPPHAPLHSLMAAAAFALAGPRDWAPYALSGILVLFFLLLVWRETARFGTPGVVAAVAAASFVPVVYQSVHQFRPDFPCALVMLWGMVIFPRWGSARFGFLAAISGACFGLALLAKPPFFPYTLAMGFLPWALTVVGGWREGGSLKALGSAIAKTWPFFVGCAVVAGPHYAIAWRHIVEYIRLNQFGDSAHIWKMTGGLDFQLVYHLIGYSGQIMFGPSIWLLCALAVGGFGLAVLWRSREPQIANQMMRLLGFVVWAWLLIAWNPHMNPFFGLTFQYAVVLAASVSVGWGSRLVWQCRFPKMLKVLVPGAIVVGMGVLMFPMIDYKPEFTRADAVTRDFARKIPAEVFDSLQGWRPVSDSGYTLLSTYGLLSSHRLQWMANKAREDFRFYAVPYWDAPEQIALFHPDNVDSHRVDFALIAEPGALGIYEDLPNAETTGEVLEWIRTQDYYILLDSFPTPSGASYHLYMAPPNFSVFRTTHGLSPKSAPLRMSGTPVVRAAIADSIRLVYDSPQAGSATLQLALRGQPPVNRVEVGVNGRHIGSVPVQRSAEFPAFEMELPLRVGENLIELSLQTEDGSSITNPRVQFRRISIIAPGDQAAIDDVVRKTRRRNMSESDFPQNQRP